MENLKKYKFPENSKMNIFGNILIEKTISNMSFNYINFFNTNNIILKDNLDKKYLFFLDLSRLNIMMLLDSNSIMDGKLLNNEYNNLLSESDILLLFFKIKLFIISNLNKICDDNDYHHELIEIISNYDNYLDEKNYFLNKYLPKYERLKKIREEFNKFELRYISIVIILSFYLYKNKELLIKFIEKVDNLTSEYINKMDFENINFKLNKASFWKYISTSI